MKKIKCPFCGHKSPATEERCEECGGPLPEPPPKPPRPEKKAKTSDHAWAALLLTGLISITAFGVPTIIASLRKEAPVSASMPPSTMSLSSSQTSTPSTTAAKETTKPKIEIKSSDAPNPVPDNQDPLQPPYDSYNAEDYPLPGGQVSSLTGSGDNGILRISVSQVRRAPFLKYATFDLDSYSPEERDEAWHQALHCDVIICEVEFENRSDTEVTFYSSDFKVSLDQGGYTINRPPMEVTASQAYPIEAQIKLISGETRSFVAAFTIRSEENMTKFRFMDSLERDTPMEEVSVFLPMEPLNSD